MQNRDSQFEALLHSDRLDSYALKHACLRGIPDNLRAETWRHLLGIVELDSPAKGDSAGSGWHSREESKLRHRRQYNELASELLERVAASAPIDPEARRKTPQDVWLDDIDKDVRRTQTSYAFFAQYRPAVSPIPDSARRVLFDRLNHLHPHRQEEIEERYSLGSSTADQPEPSAPTSYRHFECLIRLLYVFAALNPVHYVQGMSELVAPLYYVFSTGPSSTLAEGSNQSQYAEADTFWAFTTLMGIFGDFYVQDSDGHFSESVADVSLNGLSPQSSPVRHLRVSVQHSPSARSDASEGGRGSTTGLGSTLRRFARQLHWLDGELAHNLHRRKEIQPTFYALRWITCLFAMEFRIPDLVRIWDSLFALIAGQDGASHGTLGDKADGTASQARDFVLDVCCAMVLMKRGELLSGSFAACLGTLQNYLCDDIDALLAIAFSIREKRVAATLTGLDFSDYSSMPSSPAVPGTEDADSEGRFLDPYNGNGPQAAVMTNAKSMLASVASSGAAKGLRQRFWKTRDTSQSHDFPDDVSDLSAATAPAILEGPASAFSPRQRAPPLIPTGQGSSPTLRSSTNTAPTSMPTSASTLFNKYASTFSQSDAAAALSKATTNSYIAALGWREAAQPTITKLRSDVEARVTGAAGAAKASIRPPSPNMDPPFTPPTANTGRWLTPEGAAPTGSVGERRGSAGPKPLLLSGSARRASTQLHDGVAAAGNTSSGLLSNGTPGSARKASWQAHQQHSSLGLGLPHSSSTSHLESPSAQRFMRSPSPTAGFRPLPASGSPAHGRGASVSLGTYRIGNGARSSNGSTTPKNDSHEVTTQPRSSSFAGSLPTTTSTSARLQDVMSASTSISAPAQPLRSLEANSHAASHRSAHATHQGDVSNTSISSDDIPLSQLQLKMASLPATPGPKSPEQGKTRSQTDDSKPFSVLRNRGESNDLEILDDGIIDNDESRNGDPMKPTPPSASPPAGYSALDDMPISPTGGVSLSRHSLRKPRVSSLANVNQDRSDKHDAPVSPSTTIRSMTLEDPPVSPTSTAAQQPQKARRKLASSRRTSSRTESASLVESLGSTRSSMDVPSAVLE